MATEGPIKKKSYRLSKLTEEERHLAQEAWIQVEINSVIISKSMFSKLFVRHPQFRDFFKYFFTGKGIEEFWVNPKFEKHMVQVLIPAIGNIVKTVNNPSSLKNTMETLGAVHKGMNLNITAKDVQILKETFFEVLRETLGDTFSPEHEESLYKVISVGLRIFEENL